jgi:hypothetical protein
LLLFHAVSIACLGDLISGSLAEWRPSPLLRAQRKQTCYMQCGRTSLFFHNFIHTILLLFYLINIASLLENL